MPSQRFRAAAIQVRHKRLDKIAFHPAIDIPSIAHGTASQRTGLADRHIGVQKIARTTPCKVSTVQVASPANQPNSTPAW